MSEIKKRVRDETESESEYDSPEAKRIRSDLLGILDDAEASESIEATQETQDLASVMKSFEEEIAPVPAQPEQPEIEIGLGYLFEASDDELGLPPAFAEENGKEEEEELPRVLSYGFGLDDEEMWRFEDEMQSYDFGVLGENSNTGEFLALDGLFDHSDVYPGQSDMSDFLYRPESLSAL